MKKLIIMAILGYAAYWVYANKWSYSDSSLKAQVAVMNKGLPMKISPEFKLMSVDIRPGKILTYHTEFWMDSKYLPENASENMNTPAVRKAVAAELCKEKVVSEGMKHGVSIIYAFHSRDQKPIAEINFTAQDCP